MRIETSELPGGTSVGVIGAASVLELICCRKSSGVSLALLALGIKGTG